MIGRLLVQILAPLGWVACGSVLEQDTECKVCFVLFFFPSPQIRYDVWRRLLKTFWAVVVGYSMVVLIAIYMYQFRSVSALFRQIMGMSEEGWVSVAQVCIKYIRSCVWIQSEPCGRLGSSCSLSSDFSVYVIWVWNGTTQWSCSPVSCFQLHSYWLVSFSCTTSTQTSWLSLTSTMFLSDKLPGEMARICAGSERISCSNRIVHASLLMDGSALFFLDVKTSTYRVSRMYFIYVVVDC